MQPAAYMVTSMENGVLESGAAPSGGMGSGYGSDGYRAPHEGLAVPYVQCVPVAAPTEPYCAMLWPTEPSRASKVCRAVPS